MKKLKSVLQTVQTALLIREFSWAELDLYSKNTYYSINLLLINLAGFPPHISYEGISFVTTEPAPTTAPSPIVTELQIME